jgi:hypothetical protein
MVGRHYLQLSAASYPEHRSGRGPMSGWGQNAKYSVRVNVFRFASKLGHYAVRSASRKRASRRHRHFPVSHFCSSSPRILLSTSLEGACQFPDILQFFKAINKCHDAFCTGLADDRDCEVHEFSFERRSR